MKKDSNGIDGIALRELIPSGLPSGIKLSEWDDFVLLGKDNLVRFIQYWRRQERSAKKEFNKWKMVIDSVEHRKYPAPWSKGDQVDEGGECEHPYCHNCRHGVYSSSQKKGREIVMFTCSLRTEMGITRPFSNTPIGVARDGSCRIAYEQSRRQREKIARKAGKLMLKAMTKRQRIAGKIAILEHLVSLAEENVPILPIMRRLSDFYTGDEVGEIRAGEDTVRSWRVSNVIKDDKTVSIFTYLQGGVTRVDDAIQPQDPKFAMAQDVFFMRKNRRFAELWMSSIRDDPQRWAWRRALNV